MKKTRFFLIFFDIKRHNLDNIRLVSKKFGLVLHKIQDFQESCLGLVLKARQDCYTQDQDQDKIKNVKTKTRQD